MNQTMAQVVLVLAKIWLHKTDTTIENVKRECYSRIKLAILP